MPTVETDPKILWEDALEGLRNQLPDHIHESLTNLLHPVEIRDRLLILEAPSDFFRDWLQGGYREQVQTCLRNLVGDTEFSLLIRSSSEPMTLSLPPQFVPVDSSTPIAAPSPAPTLNPRYVFESFVVGSSNKFAYAAAEAVAKAPGRAYNPLIIWGGVGLGKTHLLHAIGHTIVAGNPSARVLCINSEQFVNDMVRALRDGSMMEFKARYRKADLLIVDDIQFLEGKEFSQEEFFHTFNELHESRRQIVASSDRHPSELSRLEERLRSRFQMGVVVDISPPDFELRLAILQKKAQVEHVPLPDDVAHFLAATREANIRELEGDLTTVLAYCSMHHLSLTVESAQGALRGRLSTTERKITVETIQREVSRHYGIPIPDLRSQARTADIVRGRQVAMYLCRQLVSNISLSEIGARFGGRDHTTVLHSLEKIQSLCETDPAVADEVQRLSKQVRSLA